MGKTVKDTIGTAVSGFPVVLLFTYAFFIRIKYRDVINSNTSIQFFNLLTHHHVCYSYPFLNCKCPSVTLTCPDSHSLKNHFKEYILLYLLICRKYGLINVKVSGIVDERYLLGRSNNSAIPLHIASFRTQVFIIFMTVKVQNVYCIHVKVKNGGKDVRSLLTHLADPGSPYISRAVKNR